MWLNPAYFTDDAVRIYRQQLLQHKPRYVVIDQLFNSSPLEQVLQQLQLDHGWQTQKHTYDKLYVNDKKWQNTPEPERFVKRDLWLRNSSTAPNNIAQQFLDYLRGEEFLKFLSRLFKVQLTDKNVADPALNTNYFRLGSSDFVHQHADDSPGREVCMLLYLNKDWQADQGGDLVFQGQHNQTIAITPLFNRCVLFDPASAGAEHWVNAVKAGTTSCYRYNVTSWYWSE
ncbi:2OG-Fe(II) oxygenase [Alishewanella sp. d11]|uniref:2OG-Fe(II) oxygenase n=1 Tax=Alishewanella sp. d11 TaxID=3414030 RepID=UPI003BF7C43A